MGKSLKKRVSKAAKSTGKNIMSVGKAVTKGALSYSTGGMFDKKDKDGGGEDDYRGEAAQKMLKNVNKQAGSAQINYTTEENI